MAGIAGLQTGSERVIWHSMRDIIFRFKMLQVAINTREALLMVLGVRKFHARFLMTVNAQLRSIVITGCIAGNRELQGSAVRIVTGRALHPALIMRTALPILPAKTRITVAAPAQVRAGIC